MDHIFLTARVWVFHRRLRLSPTTMNDFIFNLFLAYCMFHRRYNAVIFPLTWYGLYRAFYYRFMVENVLPIYLRTGLPQWIFMVFIPFSYACIWFFIWGCILEFGAWVVPGCAVDQFLDRYAPWRS